MRITDITHDIKYMVMKLIEPQAISFKPGQYIQFRIPEAEEFRAYSIASPPSQAGEIELVVRLVPGGLCSSYIHEVLDVNDEITVTGPYGDFYLREDSQREIVCIGGGCGMAPIRSILFHLKEKGMPRKISYFFGARGKKTFSIPMSSRPWRKNALILDISRSCLNLNRMISGRGDRFCHPGGGTAYPL